MRTITTSDIGKSVTLKSSSGEALTGDISDISPDGKLVAIAGRLLPILEWTIVSSDSAVLIKTESVDHKGDLLLG